MKSVSDRFLGVASELGREQLPQKQRREYLRSMGLLLDEFPLRFPSELFNPRGMPREWLRVGDAAKRSHAELAIRYTELSRLDDGLSDATFQTRFQAASRALLPLAEELREALTATRR